MNNPSNIERSVMRRIYIIRTLRPIVSGGTLAALVFMFALWSIGREVWVAHVFANAPKNITDLPQFYTSAFENTRFVVQALAVVTIASFSYVVRESTRAFFALAGFARA